MLTLENLIWTIPGICFLFSYNRLRDVESVEFSGWPFVFFIVLIGAITLLPLKYFFNHWSQFNTILVASSIAFFIPFIIKFLFEFFIKKLEKDENFFVNSNFWSVIYFFYPLENKDKFIKNCIDHEGQPVLVTTEEPVMIFQKNTDDTDYKRFYTKARVFFGILIEFPYVATKVTDSQVIRILPLLSGYKYIKETIKETKEKIRWTEKYEINKDSTGIIIPRNKILNFSPYVEEDHKELVFDNNEVSC